MASWEEPPLPRSFDSVFYGAAGTPTGAADNGFNRVSFLSHFDGANNGVNNAFDDGSASNHTITVNGNVTQGSFGPFARPDGEWGWDFDSSAEGLVLDYGSTSHNYWNGNFTFEFWINTTDAGSLNVLFGCWADNSMSGGSYSVGFSSNGKVNVSHRQSSAGNGGAFITCATATNDGAWHHIAITQVDDGGNTKYSRIFVDGVLDAYDTETAWTQGASGQEITIGGLSIIASSYESSRRYTGLISNWRIVESIVYSTASTTIGATIFTPPTGPLTAISNTRILTCQSNRFVDNSSNGYGVATNGNGKTTAFGPLLTDAVYDPAVNGASAYFDGTADALSVASSPISASGNFTLEGWAYSNSASEQVIVGQYQGRSTGRMSVYINSGLLIFFQNGVTGGNSGSNVALGQWAHFVLQRTGSNIAFYVNGARVLNNSAGNIAQDYLVIGTEDVNSGNYPNTFNGYISNIRITSSAVYSEGATITVPTAPYSTVTNTNLLLNMADGQAIDSAAQNNLTLYGTAKTSTAQKLFGTASLLLDGDSDYATIPSEAGNFGAGHNFTIEFSFRLAADVDATQTILAKWRPADNQRSWMVSAVTDSGNKIRFWDSANGTAYTSTNFATSFSSETWYRIAIVNVSGTVKMYVNGTADSTTHTLATGAPFASAAQFVRIGARINSSDAVTAYFNGNLDDVRLSKFARYTGNYTAQSEPFPDKGQ